MERSTIIEWGLNGLILIAAGWLVFEYPFERGPQQDAAQAATPAAIELDSTDGSGLETGQRALAGSRQTAGEAEQEAERPALDPRPNLMVVTAGPLNLRDRPNAQSQSLGLYPEGEVVEPMTRRGNWVLVRVREDQAIGWMYGQYLASAAGD